MNKLTADKCREQFEAWWQESQHDGNPPRFGWGHYRDGDTYSDDEFQTLWEAWKASREALEIALPVLEQQEKGEDGWVSCKDELPLSEGEYIVYESLNKRVQHNYWMEPVPFKWFWNHYDNHVTHWMPLPSPPQSKPSTTPQIDNDGWIDWKGNGPTIAILGKTVEVRFQDNDTDAGPSRHFYWGSNCGNRIIAYRVIENDGREG